VPLNWEQYPTIAGLLSAPEAALRQIHGVTAVGMSDSLPPMAGTMDAVKRIWRLQASPLRCWNGRIRGLAAVTPVKNFPCCKFQSLKVRFYPGGRGSKEGFVIVSKELPRACFLDSNAFGQHIEHSVLTPNRMPGPVYRSQELRQM